MIHPFGVTGFILLTALSTRNDKPTQASRPFDRDRDGFILGEGAGMLILEELEHAQARGARIYGEITGYGNGFRPRGADSVANGRRVIRAALAGAPRVPCVFGGANSTATGDRLEAQTLRAAFDGEQGCPPVSAVKSMCGECLDASGALQAAAALLALAEQVVPPTINHRVADDDCAIDCVPNTARRMEVSHALVTASSSAGHVSALVLSASPAG